MKNLLSIFVHGNNTISSKRVCGVIGWLAVLALYGYNAYKGQETVDLGELIAGCVALLGVDSVTDIFKKDDTE